ncbi:YALI0E25828p [Yarrowia lipolytica CLIB122]|uniref:YALI0E25828p n=2 Tax=Yarrowia lipolytica TaxID=4952 RepID=Q6C4L3_YARLI|nr:YALI0E25828p [Yarrowia lipolytica CLIB122]AOW05964.1 hypothetical protein YALI1_E30621g [Yarrowia lipolytica]CAG79999.1 YALI0E25828p [Yarrowia lipolytica CLIB122]SEI33432.1 YALIA101S03e18162g1_1 [Yarrowia lipolytica]VBB77878.1 Hypothetical protein YALIH222_S01E10220G [Yarrowia lipolytica]|eukprot:XP_504399.1 YALI0E25828p [Yarrowia lipolytica CLIB122]
MQQAVQDVSQLLSSDRTLHCTCHTPDLLISSAVLSFRLPVYRQHAPSILSNVSTTTCSSICSVHIAVSTSAPPAPELSTRATAGSETLESDVSDTLARFRSTPQHAHKCTTSIAPQVRWSITNKSTVPERAAKTISICTYNMCYLYLPPLNHVLYKIS